MARDRKHGFCRFIKWFIIAINTVMLISGICMIVVGFYARFCHGKYVDDLNTTFENLPWALVGLGAIMAGVSFIACCGAWMESRCALSLFLAVMFFIMLAQVAIAVCAFVEHDKIPGYVDDAWHNDMSDDQIIDVEKEFKCCGYTNSTDRGVQCDPSWTKPCEDDVISTMKNAALALGFTALIVFGVQLIAFACPLGFCCDLQFRVKDTFEEKKTLLRAKHANKYRV
eukprot:TRINITY_DN17911_c0_g1_i1.p1 TRINITY_DN17911_c0_g1~~TRINITY_DN17911_c0_g1_i1.p1  ORF type:complete len:227 (-),score=65.70 TRINITY_DN17911_c0_g1_i1:207-887(-)